MTAHTLSFLVFLSFAAVIVMGQLQNSCNPIHPYWLSSSGIAYASLSDSQYYAFVGTDKHFYFGCAVGSNSYTLSPVFTLGQQETTALSGTRPALYVDTRWGLAYYMLWAGIDYMPYFTVLTGISAPQNQSILSVPFANGQTGLTFYAYQPPNAYSYVQSTNVVLYTFVGNVASNPKDGSTLHTYIYQQGYESSAGIISSSYSMGSSSGGSPIVAYDDMFFIALNIINSGGSNIFVVYCVSECYNADSWSVPIQPIPNQLQVMSDTPFLGIYPYGNSQQLAMYIIYRDYSGYANNCTESDFSTDCADVPEGAALSYITTSIANPLSWNLGTVSKALPNDISPYSPSCSLIYAPAESNFYCMFQGLNQLIYAC